MAPSSYHRMRSPERCEECSTRLWYEQEGLRYCRNGHQLEGFASHEAGEDEYGTTGKVSRARKEKRQRAAVKLEGAEGRKLYLEVLQHILRKQIWWMIGDQGYPKELEAVVRGLWRYCLEALATTDDRSDNLSGTESEGAAAQSELDDSDASTRAGWMKIPSLPYTLALCYLGCVVLRLPVTTADFHAWAMKGEIEFLGAV
jgi:RNA polymerase I-specific transcription initiation factor RRN7